MLNQRLEFGREVLNLAIVQNISELVSSRQNSAMYPNYQFGIQRFDEVTKEWDHFIDNEEDQFSQSYLGVINATGGIYVCGNFTKIGKQTISRLARHQGDFVDWATVGGTAPNDSVIGMLSNSAKDLIIFGNFTSVGGISANRIARWNGTSWSAFSSGLNGNVGNAAIDSQGNIYVSGSFTTAGGVSANRLAKWSPSGSTWSSLGSGLIANDLVGFRAMLVDSSDDLWIAGGFTTVSGISATRVARWSASGSTWSTIGSGFNAFVTGMIRDDSGNIYFTGPQLTQANGRTVTNFTTKWDGITFSDTGLPSAAVGSMASFNGPQFFWLNGKLWFVSDIINGGVTSFYVFENSTWIPLVGAPSGRPGNWARTYRMILHEGKIWLTGASDPAGSATFGGFVRRRDSKNESLASRTLTTSNADFWYDESTRRLFLVGNVRNGQPYFDTDYGSRTNSKYYDPNTGTWVHFLVTNTSGVQIPVKIGSDYYFTSRSNSSDNMLGQSLVRWDGVGIRTGFSTVGGNFTGVRCVGTDGTDLYVGGSFTAAPGGVSATRAAKWNGTSWSALGTGLNQNGDVIAWNQSDSLLYFGGDFTTAGGATANYVASWNTSTSTWSSLGSGTNGYVSKLIYDSNERILYACGSFTTAGGVSASRIAKWNAATSTWSSIGGISYQYFNTNIIPNMKFDSKRRLLYFCGGFHAIVNGVVLQNVGVWSEKDQRWYPLSESNMRNSDGKRRSGFANGVSDVFPLPDRYWVS